jgi:beta-1,3-galactosyltransferase 1
MGLRWIENYCKEPKYILKTHDDVWVNINRFEDYFESNTIEEQFFGGKCVIEMPERDRKSKRYVSEEDFPGNHYPASCR